jgi:hypothetical protein
MMRHRFGFEQNILHFFQGQVFITKKVHGVVVGDKNAVHISNSSLSVEEKTNRRERNLLESSI